MRCKINIYLIGDCMDCMRKYVICLTLWLEILDIQYLFIIITHELPNQLSRSIMHKVHAASVNILSNTNIQLTIRYTHGFLSQSTSFFQDFFKLKDNCFIEFCCFLSNLNMNQPQIYICPLPLKLPPISLPIPPLQVDTEPLLEFPEPYGKFPLALYFTHGNVSCHVTLSIDLALPSPLPMSISLFSISVSPFLPCK